MLNRADRWCPLLCTLGLLALLCFQAFAYYFKLDLSLGPRVVLEPWLLRHGYLLYDNVVDHHTPLMSVILTTLAPLCLDGLSCAKIVLVTLISLSSLLTFWAARRAVGWVGGLGATLFFVIWSPAFGFGKLWHETFLTPLYVLALIFYDASLSHRSAKRLLCLGFVGGIAMLVKQHAAVVVGACVLWNAFTSWRVNRSYGPIVRDTGVILIAALLPLVGFAAYHYATGGTLDSLFYWTISYNMRSDFRTLAALAPDIGQITVIASACLLLPATVVYFIDLIRKGDETYLRLGWGLMLLGASSLTAYPRFEFFHLQPVLPVLAWLSVLTVAQAVRPKDAGLKIGSGSLFALGTAMALILFWIVSVGPRYQPVFVADRPRNIREYTNLVPLAEETREHIGPTDCIYIFPDDEATANLYYLMRCPPPKFWVFNYPWFMLGHVKNRILLTLEEEAPKWIVYPVRHWDTERYAPEVIRYIEGNYQRRAALHWAPGDMWLLERRQ